jgi:hypothetical protein
VGQVQQLLNLRNLEQELDDLQRRRAPESIELFQLSKDSLIDLAKKAKIPNPGGMNKLQLIQSIQALNVAKDEIAKVISKEEKEEEEEEDYAQLADSGLNAMSLEDLRDYAEAIRAETDDNAALPEFKLKRGRPSKIKYIKAIYRWETARDLQEEAKDVYRDDDLPLGPPKARKPPKARNQRVLRSGTAPAEPEGSAKQQAKPSGPQHVRGQPSSGLRSETAAGDPRSGTEGASRANVSPAVPANIESKYNEKFYFESFNEEQIDELRNDIKSIDRKFDKRRGKGLDGKKEEIRKWVEAGGLLPERREPAPRAGVTPEQTPVPPALSAAAQTPAKSISDASKKGLLRQGPPLRIPGLSQSATEFTVPESPADTSTPSSSMFLPSRTTSNVSTVVPPGSQMSRAPASPALAADQRDLELGDVDPNVASGIYASTPIERENKSEPKEPDLSPEFNIGGGKNSKEFGIDNHTIDRYLSRFGNEYLGCVACDEIPSKIYPKIRPRSRGFFVMNTDPSYKGGCHWVCVYMDARPSGSNSLEYFDSFADPIPPRLQSDLKGIAERLDAKTYLKLKENRVKFQSESSDNCGHFCMEFICDRMRGKPFPEASKFNDSVRGEDEVNRWKTQNGFGFLPSFGRIISSLPRPQVPAVVKNAWSNVKTNVTNKFEDIRQNFFPAKKLPQPVQVLFDKYKNNRVISAQIRREPIFAIIDKVINLISGGKFDEAKREQGYDKMFHLSLIITLDNGVKLLIEKNERINMTTNWKDTDKVEYFNVGPIFTNPTLEQFFQNTEKAVGDHRFFTYNAFDQNCQRFIADLLQSNNSLSDNAKNFILQDAQSIVKKMPFFVSKIAQFATDTAGRVKQFFGFGNSKITKMNKRKLRFQNFIKKLKYREV